MSEVKRYTESCGEGGGVVEHRTGEFVEFKWLEAGLRREVLAKEESKEHLSVVLDQRVKIDDLQQRLVYAREYVQKIAYSAKGQDSIATGYLSDILDVLGGKK